jgi:hypothetical protein
MPQSADCEGSFPEERCTTKEIRSAEVNVFSARALGDEKVIAGIGWEYPEIS